MKTSIKARVATFSGVAGAATLLAVMVASPASAETTVDRPDSFTSAFSAAATPDQVVGPDGALAPGQPGATGTFNLMINSDLDVVCYDITLNNVTAPYQSKAKTSTHLHEAAKGESGPPRLAFPNPEGEGTATSSGCMQGPFTTGLMGDNGKDTGEGFTLKQIEANPAGFAADTHTSAFVPGAVRGQLTMLPMGGVDTGVAVGPAAAPGVVLPVALGALGVAALGTVVVVRARTRNS